MRPGTNVRPAAADDLGALVDLCLTAREEAGTGSALCTDDADRLRQQLATALMFPESVVLVAVHDGGLDGMLLARVVGPSLFSDTVAVDLEALYVLRENRRRGVGHALLGSLVAVAEENRATDIYASPLPGARGVQRFLARLGFQPAATHRVVSTAALQRRLAVDPVTPATGSVRRVAKPGVDRLIALRRRSRGPVTSQVPVQLASATSMQVSREVHSLRPASSSTTTS